MSEPSTTTIHPPQDDEARASSPVSGSDPLIQRRFRRSSIAFYLRTAVQLTEEDLQVSRSRTLLGLVPLWRSRRSFLVDYVEQVSAAKHVSIGGLLLGFLLGSIGLFATLTGSVVVEFGAVAIALGVFSVLRSPKQAIVVRQAVGGSKRYGVAITERRHIARFAEQASTTLDELHRRRGPVDLSEPRRRWRRHVLVKRLAALGVVVAVVAGVGYGATRGPEIYHWLDQEGARLASNHGHWDLPDPSGRVRQTPNPNAIALDASRLPALPAITPVLTDRTHLPYASPMGFDGILKRYQSTQYATGVGPYGIVTGFLVAKERQSDGSYLFGVELPYLESPSDLLTRESQSSTPEHRTATGPGPIDNPGQEDIVGGAVVWLAMFPAETTTDYLVSEFCYAVIDFQAGGCGVVAAPTGLGPAAFFEDARIGDPIRASMSLGFGPTTLAEMSQWIGSGSNIDGWTLQRLTSEVQGPLDQNLASAQRLVSDSGKAIPYEQQLQGKRYVFNVDTVVFLPWGSN